MTSQHLDLLIRAARIGCQASSGNAAPRDLAMTWIAIDVATGELRDAIAAERQEAEAKAKLAQDQVDREKVAPESGAAAA